ncbi:pilus assembly protein [Pelagibacterium flavum]|uniref:Pilus assembly protein n=1 Tax=Pelagibacterium flavum TaxID=2984530 RepID=A0ABY6IMM2_9HYPH|nr:TadE/TadG family type IV pilus assembly protein [Pelagibacterium sp. YIM 151497]UYQ71841.1 pilus assembly protein [Pelagibacterium sp. YIM 151497]|tara:strand:- start:2784 stop:3344 length:561 start_codon:yes stop_codon:yes gene_type:complete
MGTTAKKVLSETWLVRGLAQRFVRCNRGVTAVEFAVVGPVFFAFIGATLETALAFFAGYALDTAIIDSSRLIRTGQSAYISSEANYREAVCSRLYGLFDCDQIRMSVRAIDDFGSFSMTDPIDPDSGDWTMEDSFASAEPLQTMMVEAYYKWPTFFNIPGLNAGQTADGKRLLATTHVIRTEPFTL